MQKHESLIEEAHDPLISFLNKCVVFGVKVLAILMVLVIWQAVLDVIVQMYKQLGDTSTFLFSTENLISILGDFLAALIAIEVFLNIIFYLKKDAIHVPLVLSTALTAVARKVIILDYKNFDPQHIYAIAAIIFAIGIPYWLISNSNKKITLNNEP